MLLLKVNNFKERFDFVNKFSLWDLECHENSAAVKVQVQGVFTSPGARAQETERRIYSQRKLMEAI